MRFTKKILETTVNLSIYLDSNANCVLASSLANFEKEISASMQSVSALDTVANQLFSFLFWLQGHSVIRVKKWRVEEKGEKDLKRGKFSAQRQTQSSKGDHFKL